MGLLINLTMFVWEFPNLVVCYFFCRDALLRSSAPFCPLLRSFAYLHLRSLRSLRSFASFCVRSPRTTRLGVSDRTQAEHCFESMPCRVVRQNC